MLPDTRFVEMPRNPERSFCCGAGGARMWMEETIGTRINETRTAEAVGTGAEKIAVGCPFCRVMLSDGLTAAQSKGEAREEVEVLDVAQMLLASVKGESQADVEEADGHCQGRRPRPRRRRAPQRRRWGYGDRDDRARGETRRPRPSRTPGDTTQTEETVTETEDVGAAAKASRWRLAVRPRWRRRLADDSGDDATDRGAEDETEDKAEPEAEEKDAGRGLRWRLPVRRRR